MSIGGMERVCVFRVGRWRLECAGHDSAMSRELGMSNIAILRWYMSTPNASKLFEAKNRCSC